MIYGYNAKLEEWSIAKIEDYSNGFLQGLKTIRRGIVSSMLSK